MSDINLLSPGQLGALTLKNRTVMAPLTRMRTSPGGIPNAMMAEYYGQRSTAGLIISEASQVSPQGVGYPGTPGIHSPEQIAGWKEVTTKVHNQGGKMFLQLWHVGRISHPDLQPQGQLPLAPSAIQPAGEAITATGFKPFVTPRALELEELPEIVAQYRRGAENAKAAGFDGVEVHAANGYLLDQFLQDCSNQRQDRYGGSLENRFRLVREVLEAVIEVWGSDRVGIRLSPSGSFNDMGDSNPSALFSYVVQELVPYNLAYLHLVEPRVNNSETLDEPCSELTSGFFRKLYPGTIMAAGAYSQSSGDLAIAQGDVDFVAFGRLYISNPDLVARFAQNAPLNDYDRNTFYGGDATGYLDYPFLAE